MGVNPIEPFEDASVKNENENVEPFSAVHVYVPDGVARKIQINMEWRSLK